MKWFCIIILLVTTPNVFSQVSKESDRLVAIVNGDIITYQQVYEKVKNVVKEIENSDLNRQQKEILKQRRFQLKLRDMVDSLLIQQEAKKYKIDLPDKENIKNKVQEELKDKGEAKGLDEIALEDIYYSRELLRGLFQTKSSYSQQDDRRAEIDTFVLPMEMKQYYEDNISLFTKPGKIKTRIITLFFSKYGGREQTIQTASAVVSELRRGADFIETAKNYSQDPYAETGGDWPRVEKDGVLVWDFFGKGELHKEVEDIAFSMAEGEISEPIVLDNSCQIVKIEAIQKQETTPFSDYELQDNIRRKLQNEKVIKALIQITERLRKESYIWPKDLFEDKTEY